MNSYPLQGLRFKATCMAALIFMFLLAAIPLFPGFFGRVESALYDQRIRLAGPISGSENIVLLDIDDASLRELGKWPWDRSIHAKGVETLSRCEADLIVYDIVFHGDGSANGDDSLVKAVGDSGRVILPAGFSLHYEPEIIPIELNGIQPAIDKSILKTPIPDLPETPQADRSFLPLPRLANQAYKLGHISAAPDEDGVLRRVPLAIGINGQPFPSIGLEAAIHMLEISTVRWTSGYFLLEGKGHPICIPVDESGSMAVNFSGGWGDGFTHLSFADVIVASGDPEAESELKQLISGKTVIIGQTSSGSTDIGPTAVSSAEPLATIHSNAINTILRQSFIYSAPLWANILAATAITGAICLLGFRFGPRRFVLATALLISLYIAANILLFISTGAVLNLSGIIYCSMSIFLVVLGLKSLLLFAENEARRIEREKLQVQLDAAGKIQSHFWPQTPDLGTGDKIFAYSSPALFVGGDLYDIIPLEDDSWIIYLADVSGKGLPAALVMASTWTQIRSSSAHHKTPDKLLAAVNRNLYPFLVRDSNFVTVLMLRYFPQSGLMQWVNGGHMKPLIIGKDGPREISGMTCMPLGVFDEAEYKMEETVLEPGESCIMMSDGVTEAEDSEKQLLGEKRVIDALLKAKSDFKGEALAETVRKWRNDIEQNDDTTIVEIRRKQN